MLAKIVATLIALMKDTNADVRRSAVKAVKRFAKACPGMGGRAIEVSRSLAFHFSIYIYINYFAAHAAAIQCSVPYDYCFSSPARLSSPRPLLWCVRVCARCPLSLSLN